MISAHLCWLALFYQPKIFFGKEKSWTEEIPGKSAGELSQRNLETIRPAPARRQPSSAPVNRSRARPAARKTLTERAGLRRTPGTRAGSGWCLVRRATFLPRLYGAALPGARCPGVTTLPYFSFSEASRFGWQIIWSSYYASHIPKTKKYMQLIKWQANTVLGLMGLGSTFLVEPVLWTLLKNEI